MMNSHVKLKPSKIVVSLFLGAFIGATISCGLVGVEQFKRWSIMEGMTVFVMALIIWAFAVCSFGGVAWFVLHKISRTHWTYALFAGFIIPFIIILSIQSGFFTGNSGYTSFYANGDYQVIDGKLTAFGWKMAFLMAFQYAVIGAIIAFEVWLLNYKRNN